MNDSLEPREKTIGGIRFSSVPMSPLTNYPLAIRVMGIMTPILSRAGGLDPKQLAGLAEAAKDLTEIDMAAALRMFGPLIEELVKGLALPANAKLPQELLAGTRAILTDEEGDVLVGLGTPDGINRVFAGKSVLVLLQAMLFAAQHNFADYFPGASVTGRVKAATPKTANHSG